MNGNLKLLINFVWKFLGTVCFGNDHVVVILGLGDLQWGNILITRVYFVEGLGHNLFSVRQFCDSDLEVTFRRNTCFIINLEGVDLLQREEPLQQPLLISIFMIWPPVKRKRASHPPKPVPNSKQRLHLLHMDLCGPMRIASINEKRVVEQRNRTLVEAATTMLIFSRAPLFLWAEAIATACYTQNRFIIHRRFDKTPYELINGRKPDISFLYVFGALCYPKNNREDIGKLGAKGEWTTVEAMHDDFHRVTHASTPTRFISQATSYSKALHRMLTAETQQQHGSAYPVTNDDRFRHRLFRYFEKPVTKRLVQLQNPVQWEILLNSLITGIIYTRLSGEPGFTVVSKLLVHDGSQDSRPQFSIPAKINGQMKAKLSKSSAISEEQALPHKNIMCTKLSMLKENVEEICYKLFQKILSMRVRHQDRKAA
ncbi:retrovirus-related pol polyprotein from transposon TNT 1-94 [Tanacetum coccineum]